ncbi:MAG: hypothetical protein IH945_05085 [Armatimonadetes bacterium]|nr:hypothetical protein [Armatimonadota bacterium]
MLMKFVLITKDTHLVDEARKGFHPDDKLEAFEEWEKGLDACDGADLLFVELVATLETPHKISGYEKFGEAKRSHGTAAAVPLVLVSPEEEYELDFMVGWPDFVFANVRQPVSYKIFRRASTWI